jgi:hypothetical protein
MTSARLLGTLILAAAAAAAGCSIDIRGDERVVREEKRFHVVGDLDLTLRTFDGSIHVRGWDRDEVLVEIERRGSSDADIAVLEVRVTQQDGRIVVEAPDPARNPVAFGWARPSVSYVVSMPRTVVLRARSGDGAVVATDLAGDVLVETDDGRIRTERLGGRITLHTGNGSVRVAEGEGILEVDSGDGSVDIEGRLEVVHVNTGNGRIDIDLSPGSVMKEDWSVETGNGAITLRLPARFDAEVEARTGDGGVRADEVLGGRRDRDQRERDSLRARLGNGGQRLRLESGDGRITIRSR